MSADGPHTPDPRLRMLADLTEPTEAEVRRVLDRRVTLQGSERFDALSVATEATWVEEQRLRHRTRGAAPTSADARAKSWARMTEPRPDELARVATIAVHPSIAEATAPADTEVHALTHGRMPETWVAATEPTQAEVTRLLGRRAELITDRPTSASPGWRVGLALAGAAGFAAAVTAGLFLGLSGPGATYGEPDLAPGRTAVLDSAATIELGPSIDMQPHAVASLAASTVHIAKADAQGTVVDVLEGGTRFEVDPNGTHRNLVVRARDVQVAVKGTVFTVDSLPDAVVVGVERGKVEVTPTGAEPLYLLAGQTWRSDTGLVASLDHDPAAVVLPPRPDTASGPADVGPADSDPAATPPVAAVESSPPPIAPRPVAATPVAPRAVFPTPAVEPAVERTAAPAPSAAPAAWPPGADSHTAADTKRRVQPATSRPSPEGQAAPTGEALQDALAQLSDIRRRARAHQDPSLLLHELDRLHFDSPQMAKLALDTRLDVARQAPNPAYFDEAIRALAESHPSDPRLVVLRLELGHRYLQTRRLADASRTFDQLSKVPGDLGVRGLMGSAQAHFLAGDDRLARQALAEAMRRVSDPALEDEIEAMRDGLGGSSER